VITSKDLYDEIRRRMNAVDALRIIKQRETYETMSSQLGLSPAIISRYINGRVLPSSRRTQEILKFVEEKYPPSKMIGEALKIDESGVIDDSEAISNPPLLRLLAIACSNQVKKHVDVVLTVAADGIAFAEELANVYGARLAVVKKERELGIDSFYEETEVSLSSGIKEGFYLPKKLLKKDEKVLIADDLARTGRTVRVLLRLIEDAGAAAVGIAIIVSTEAAVESIPKDVEKYVGLELEQ